MNEVTEVGAKAKIARTKKTGTAGKKAGGEGKKAGGEGKKAGGEGDPVVAGQIGRMLVRAIWGQEWALANPEAKGEARKAAWKEARAAQMEKNLKTYRRAVGSLQRSGVSMTLSAEAASKADDDDSADE